MSKKQVIIPIGKYGISSDPLEELVTVVGSCVAVTLYDKENTIGGLAHIVLPGRRTSLRADDRRAFFADTGVPLLIEAMVEAGTSYESLVANVVGGASTFADDVEDTIGSRNAHVAITILENMGIPIQKTDIGGKTGCKIILSVDTGKLDVLRSSSEPGKPVVRQNEVLTETDAKHLIRRIERLKPDDEVAGKLLEVIHDQASSPQRIQAIISKDCVLACHIFRMCNSAYYGFPGRISSISDAVRLLGRRQFRLICVVVGTMRHQEGSSADFSRLARNFNSHSSATALIARLLARHTAPELSETAYTAGLLHTVGKFVVALLSENSQSESIQDYPDLRTQPANAIAEMILTKWNLPENIIRAAADFNASPEGTADHHTLTAIVHVACGLSSLLGVCFVPKISVTEISPQILAQLGLSDGLEPILPAIFEELRPAGLIQNV